MVPAPLYKDPVFDGAADPMIIRNEQTGLYYMFYTQRRANQRLSDVAWAYGTAIGVAESKDGSYWRYRGALDLDFEFGHNTFWAPEVIYCAEDGLYHMYSTYIQGVSQDWGGEASIEHYTSRDLFYWDHIGSVQINSAHIIDPCIHRLPDGTWRMWYRDDDYGTKAEIICYADSPDLYNWTFKGVAADDVGQEGPNVFAFGGRYWLISDVWNGLGVYVSDDLEHFTRQEENILREFGTRTDDTARGAHADVFVVNDRAFIVYFTHPEPAYPSRTAVQMAELKIENGKLVCDRNAEFDTDWPARA